MQEAIELYEVWKVTDLQNEKWILLCEGRDPRALRPPKEMGNERQSISLFGYILFCLLSESDDPHPAFLQDYRRGRHRVRFAFHRGLTL